MGEELGMTSTNYSISLLVFFISYVLFETPSNMILTRVRPSIYMPVSRPLLPQDPSLKRSSAHQRRRSCSSGVACQCAWPPPTAGG